MTTEVIVIDHFWVEGVTYWLRLVSKTNAKGLHWYEIQEDTTYDGREPRPRGWHECKLWGWSGRSYVESEAEALQRYEEICWRQYDFICSRIRGHGTYAEAVCANRQRELDPLYGRREQKALLEKRRREIQAARDVTRK